MKTFAEYKQDAPNWITMANGEYYPDILVDACELYKPVLVLFGQLLKTSETSVRLLQQITEVQQSWMRVQLCRVFRKPMGDYVKKRAKQQTTPLLFEEDDCEISANAAENEQSSVSFDVFEEI